MTEQKTGDDNKTLILGKFKDNEALAQAYQELERKLGDREAPKLPDTLKARPQGDAPDLGTSAKAQASAQLLDAVNAMIAGSADAETKLVSMGLPPETARVAVGVAVGAQQQYVNGIYKVAGGEAAYKEMLRWAGENDTMSDYERESIMTEIASGNPSRVHVQVRALRQRYEQEVGNAPAELVFAPPGGEAKRIEGYATEADMTRAFSDKRYGTDSTYTAEAQARAKVSKTNTVAHPRS